MLSTVLQYVCANGDVTALLVFVFVFLFLFYTTRHPRDLPPGPRVVIPGLGNLPSFVSGDVLRVFQNWKNKFGDIYSMYVGSKLFIILGSHTIIKEAFISQSKIFTDRPKDPFINSIISDDHGIVFNSGKIWKRERNFLVSALKQLNFGRPVFEERIHQGIHFLLKKCEESAGHPFEIQDKLKSSIATIMLQVVVGDMADHDAPEFTEYVKLMHDAGLASAAGSAASTAMPFLRFLPWDVLGFKRIKTQQSTMENYLRKLFKDHKPHPTGEYFNLLDILKSNDKDRADKDNIHLVNELFVAGTETTSETITWIILHMVAYPDIQRKCRDEIIEVCGKQSLPTVDMQSSLPYVSATIFETIRLCTVAPLVLPHKASKETFIKGYRVPTNATVICNLHSIFHDPTVFDEPDIFRPSRFLNPAGELDVPEAFIPFGVGPRICVGEAAARMEIFLITSALLQKFEFLPERNCKPELKGTLTIAYTPVPCKIRCVSC